MKTVLIVDDSSYYRSRGAEVVSRAGYEYYFAENGEQAVRIYRRIKPDFVTMDICIRYGWLRSNEGDLYEISWGEGTYLQ